MTARRTPLPRVDCHVHILDPSRYPYGSDTDYRPAPNETAPVEQLIAVLDSHEISHALVVTPTAGYGPDNSVTRAALSEFRGRLRGIAVVEFDVANDDISSLRQAGFVGVRVDLLSCAATHIRAEGRRLLGMLREHGMVLEIQTENDLLAQITDVLEAEAGTIVIDHMGRPDPALGLQQPGFHALLGLAEWDRVTVKLSGPFRFSKAGFPYLDADPYARAIIDTFGPERCLWGSDWPFVRMNHRVDYGPTYSTLERWVPDEQARKIILWDNPRRLFGFGA